MKNELNYLKQIFNTPKFWSKMVNFILHSELNFIKVHPQI